MVVPDALSRCNIQEDPSFPSSVEDVPFEHSGNITFPNECTLSNYVPLIMFKPPTRIVSEYDQEIPQSQTADNPVAPRGRAAQPSRDTRKTN